MARLSPPIEKAIAEAYEAGENSTVLAQRFGCAVSTIFRALKRQGVAPQKRGPRIPSETHRRCCDCHEMYPLEAFTRHRSAPLGRGYVCRLCRSLGRHSQWGITPTRYAEILRAQGGGCAICLASDSGRHRRRQLRLEIDHCHTSGRVRGLLCVRCNLAIGQFNDDPALLLRAIGYLQQTQQVDWRAGVSEKTRPTS